MKLYLISAKGLSLDVQELGDAEEYTAILEDGIYLVHVKNSAITHMKKIKKRIRR